MDALIVLRCYSLRFIVSEFGLVNGDSSNLALVVQGGVQLLAKQAS